MHSCREMGCKFCEEANRQREEQAKWAKRQADWLKRRDEANRAAAKLSQRTNYNESN